MHVAQTITRRSLHDELVDRLRGLLLEGKLTPGEKVPERELCEQLGVSRTPMREALKVLASDGLITLIPNRGAVVKQLTEDDLRDLFEVMGSLEALAGELACKNATDAEIEAIERTHARMLDHYEQGNLPAYFDCNRRIHQLILKAARNRVLSAQYESLSLRAPRPRYAANMSDRRWLEAVREHEQILDALKARRGELLACLLKRHLAGKFDALLVRMKETGLM